ncbi:MAG: DUF3667 domain-containing protein [Pseudomonadota bacterium]
MPEWTCPNCNASATTPYCPACGEEKLRTGDLSLRVLVFQLVESATHIDGRLVRSFRYLLGRPGALTDTFLKGQRKPYVGPVALFLICNALFFATELLTGGHVFTTPLEMHLHKQPWDFLAQELVEKKLAAKRVDLDAYAPLFDQAVALKARSLIIFMALVFSLAPALIFLRHKRPLITHVVFSLHLYAFLLLLLSAALWIQATSAWFGGPGKESDTFDDVLSIGLLIASAVYLYFATGSVYGERGISRTLKTIFLTFVVANVVLGYRFALLLITLYST